MCIFSCKAHLHVLAQLCSKLQPQTHEAIYIRPARDISHHHLWIPLSKTVIESCDITFLEDPTLELIFNVTPGAKSLLQLPEPTPLKAPFIFHHIYNSDSNSNNNDDNKDIFLTPDPDNIDMNVLLLLVDDSNLFSTLLSQASQPGTRAPTPYPHTLSQSSPVLTPSHSTHTQSQPRPITTPSVHVPHTAITPCPVMTTQASMQCTPSPAHLLTTTSVSTQHTPTPSAPSHTAVPITPFKKHVIASTPGTCTTSLHIAPTKTTTQSTVHSSVSGGTLPSQPTCTSSHIKKKNTNFLNGDIWVVDDPHHHATVVQGPNILKVSGTSNMYTQAIASPDVHQWQSAMKEKFNSLMCNGTYTLVPLPPGCNII